MGVVHAFRFRLRALLDRRRMDAEIDEEMAFHITSYVTEMIGRGVPEAEARRDALSRFGGVSGMRDEVRDAEGLAPWDAVRQHLAYAAHGVRRAPLFSAMVALTLGLGIGANGAMFGIIDHLLLRGPESVARPAALRRVYVTTLNGAGTATTAAIEPYALYTLLRDQTTGFAGFAAYSPAAQVRVSQRADAASVPAVYATADFFPLLGVRPYLGRFYSAAEDRPPVGAQVVVLGYGLWRRQFGADSSVLGRTIGPASHPMTVIGVAPPGFTGVERAPVDAWLPMSSRGNTGTWATTWNATSTLIVTRLGPGMSTKVADEKVTATLRAGYSGQGPTMRHADVSVRPISFDNSGVEPPELGVARLLYGVALIVLLIAAANVANLLMARAVRRQRELAVRVALGAGRMRLASMMLAEAASLAVLGGVAGLGFAYWGGTLIRRTLLPSVAWTTSPVDPTVLAYTALVVLVTTLIVGLIPALRATRGDPLPALKAGIAQSGDQHQRMRNLLGIGQVALSLVLLFTAALFVGSLWHIRQLDLGLQPDRVLAAGVGLPGSAVRTREEAEQASALEHARMRQLLDQVRRLPGVEHASVAIGTPFYSAFGVGMSLPGHDTLPAAPGGGPWVNAVAPDYFATVGTGLLRGRVFTEADHEGSEPVVVVNQIMARTFWPNEDPLGKCIDIQWTRACTRVVGVVADARQWKLREDPAMQYYVPYGQESGIGGAMLLVRPKGDAERFAGELHSALVRIAPDARYVDVATLQSRLDPQIRPWRVGALMFGLFGLLALLVAAIGLFSVVSYLVVQRTHEMGVRIALGARAAQIARMVLGGTLGMTVIGIAIGTVASLALAPFLQPLLFDTGASNPWLLALVAAVLLGSALLAGLAPTWRACRIDPMNALRAD